jgi:hypothetical protein
MPSEPPTPSAEQLADWQALVERVGQGDRSQVVAWGEPAAGPGATYQVLVTRRVHRQLGQAPPLLAGSVVGVLAVLVEGRSRSLPAGPATRSGGWPPGRPRPSWTEGSCPAAWCPSPSTQPLEARGRCRWP